MKKIFLSIVIVGGLAFGGIFFLQRSGVSKQETEFTFEVVTRGDLENTVSSTGTLSAVGTVEVGSQISGTVDKVLVDYNDKVTKGQLLAVVDTRILETSVRDAKANVAKVQAQYNQAHTEYERNKKLFEQGFISEIALMTYKTSVETAYAELVSVKEALKKAQMNLGYANICSPIDGTVLERSIDAGQTIAASMSAPTLFTIAEDLSKMQIEALVDESDIGQIKQGMSVRFTVQAYADDEFTGTVRQVRLNPTTDQDVVNYTVIVDASNDHGLLLPGMTATIDFLVEQRQNVLLVPNTALSFQPSQEFMKTLFQEMQTMGGNGPQGSQGRPPMGSFPNQGRQSAGNNQHAESQNQAQGDVGRPSEGQLPPPGIQMGNGDMPQPPGEIKMTRVFYLDESSGKPAMAQFLAGITDGVTTEVVQSDQLNEGSRVITGMSSSQKSSAKKSEFSFPIPGMGGGPGGPPPR